MFILFYVWPKKTTEPWFIYLMVTKYHNGYAADGKEKRCGKKNITKAFTFKEA